MTPTASSAAPLSRRSSNAPSPALRAASPRATQASGRLPSPHRIKISCTASRQPAPAAIPAQRFFGTSSRPPSAAASAPVQRRASTVGSHIRLPTKAPSPAAGTSVQSSPITSASPKGESPPNTRPPASTNPISAAPA